MRSDGPTSQTPAPRDRSTRREAFAVALVLVAGFLLRAWGYDWGLWHPDEAKTVSAATAAAEGRIRPDYATYSYGALNIYWNAAAIAARRAVAGVASLPALDAAGAHRLLRLLSLASTATLRRLAIGRWLLGSAAAAWSVLILAMAFSRSSAATT